MAEQAITVPIPQAPIVDREGRPTPEFYRLIQAIVEAVELTKKSSKG